MLSHSFSEKEIDELMLSYADESFKLNDAVRFEILLRSRPEFQETAEANRTIRAGLLKLPKITARPGFEERLLMRIRQEG